jgi:selenocysteine-specific elongation factor
MTVRTLGTAGHIDHGKTSLVEALTGRNTDRLEEERRRGISIELGYALLDLGDGLELSVVDVPGHERFVRTMVAGATGIDLAVVCVACDDGVMLQTREHLAILALLGVRAGVIALTKRDLVDDEGEALARLDVEEALVGHPLEGSAIVAVSVRTGEGLTALRDALRAAAGHERDRVATTRTRLPVDRVFSLRGIGTVVTGTLWSGTLVVGDRVTVEPAGVEARIRSLQVHDRDVETAVAGGRVAACLVGVERGDVPRGSTLVAGAPVPRSYRVDARVTCLPSGPGIAGGDLVEVLHGTASTRARIVTLETARIAPGASGPAQLRLVEPLATVRGDRVVIRALAPPATIAGADVLDPLPERHGPSAAVSERLTVLAEGTLAEVVAETARGGPVRVAQLVERGLGDPAALEAATGILTASRRLVAIGDGWLVSRHWLAAAARDAHDTLAARAAATPLSPGVPVGRLLGEAPWRDALAARLEGDGVLERDGADAVLPGARAGSAAAAEAAATLLATLAAQPFSPPRLEDVLPTLPLTAEAAKALVAVLEREGRLVRLPDGLAVTRAAYDDARHIVEEGCRANGAYTLAELRDATATSRRWAQALLERMDADGITRRVGDRRVLRRAR